MNDSVPVLIVGAGPVGLTMAALLARHDIPFRIIDKKLKPVITSNATVTQTKTLEIWEDIGILPEILANGHKIQGVNLYSGKKRFLNLDLSQLDHFCPFVIGIPQSQTETILHRHLSQNGVNIELEVELINCQEHENHVTATLLHKDECEEKISVKWILACDGYHSTLRHLLNVEFPGEELEHHFIVSDIKLKTSAFSLDEVQNFFNPDGIFIIVPIDKGYSRIVADVTCDPELSTSTSPSSQQVKAVITKRCPFVLEMDEPRWSSGFWIHERMLNNYRKNRVFFAGDAAHVHSPAGGQGMNTGIQDAHNLIWKLALVIQDHAQEKLLDSYQYERRPVAQAVLKNSTKLTRVMTLRHPLLQFIRNILIKVIFAMRKNRLKLISYLTELSISYENSFIVKDLLPPREGIKAGRALVDVKFQMLEEEKRLFDVVSGTTHCLLMFTGNKTLNTMAAYKELQNKINKVYHNLVRVILITLDESTEWTGEKIIDRHGVVHKRYSIKNSCLYLIRPDRYIAFRSQGDQGDALLDYLATIFK
ncbi:hypothetical protein FOG18_05815 [Legionella israelensis]|uniref:FAD-dependent monooxygenase n=1 Tax=Legionella israelensis TaxID=454 RepID=UPI00117D5F47|nr:FAD-dependent monooxygenase [Legionella israelensis]QDP72116.1 hypothetical protein FOG18_05815 [Legionella israelensis]